MPTDDILSLVGVGISPSQIVQPTQVSTLNKKRDSKYGALDWVKTGGNIFTEWQKAKHQPNIVNNNFFQTSPKNGVIPTNDPNESGKKKNKIWLYVAIVVVLVILAIIIF